MELGAFLNTSQRFREAVDQFAALERAGLDAVWLNEGAGFDAPTRMTYLAARTKRLRIGSNVIPLSTRTPTLLAMTAASVDYLADGRVNLGLGSGGLVILEGWHGVTHDRSIRRMRATVEICRAVWARDAPLVHDGSLYRVPIAADEARGLVEPWVIHDEPVRPDIPIWQAALGDQSVALTAEIADGWLPLMFAPELADAAWGAALAAGRARRSGELGELQIAAGGLLAIAEGDEATRLRDLLRPEIAFRIGGIGPRGQNPYNLVAQRYGYEAEAELIEELYFDGNLDEAAAAVPADLLERISLIGPSTWLLERLAAYREAGVTQLMVSPIPDGFVPPPGRRQSWSWNVSTGLDVARDLIGRVRDLL